MSRKILHIKNLFYFIFGVNEPLKLLHSTNNLAVKFHNEFQIIFPEVTDKFTLQIYT